MLKKTALFLALSLAVPAAVTAAQNCFVINTPFLIFSIWVPKKNCPVSVQIKKPVKTLVSYSQG